VRPVIRVEIQKAISYHFIKEGGETMKKEKEIRLEIDELEERIAPSIVTVNGGGNTPNGGANGVPSLNPAGHEPPGHN
jgi:hypothetical protein